MICDPLNIDRDCFYAKQSLSDLRNLHVKLYMPGPKVKALYCAHGKGKQQIILILNPHKLSGTCAFHFP